MSAFLLLRDVVHLQETVVMYSYESLEQEFDVLMARSGIVVPNDRRAGAIGSYAELRHLTRLLRQPREPDAEPANVYRLDIILRGI